MQYSPKSAMYICFVCGTRYDTPQPNGCPAVHPGTVRDASGRYVPGQRRCGGLVREEVARRLSRSRRKWVYSRRESFSRCECGEKLVADGYCPRCHL